MAHVQLEKGAQARFLQAVRNVTVLTWNEIAAACEVERHTLKAWRDEEWRMSYKALVKLSRISGVPMPHIIEKISKEERRRRAGQKGAIRAQELYGNPGTPEGRSKGGRISQQRRQERPELYDDRFIVRKSISTPHKSAELAELVGILLGDGGICETGYQIVISSSAANELQYSEFVVELVSKLFGIESTIRVGSKGSRDVIVTSIAAIEYLESIGIQRGNKVRNQIAVPKWIFTDVEYTRACVRGLMDTDGSVYPETKRHKDKEYRYVNLCFTSYSAPLLQDAVQMLSGLGFHPTTGRRRNVYLRRQKEVDRYYQEVRTHNLYHLERYQRFSRWRKGAG